jgi:hypothetical protein
MYNDDTIKATITVEQIAQAEQKQLDAAKVLDAFDRWVGTIRTYGGLPGKPAVSPGYHGCIDCAVYLSKCYCRR